MSDLTERFWRGRKWGGGPGTLVDLLDPWDTEIAKRDLGERVPGQGGEVYGQGGLQKDKGYSNLWGGGA